MVLPEVFIRYRSDIENELRAAIATKPSLLNAMLYYHLGWSGESGHPKQKTLSKLVRGTLCLASCRALGGDYHKALPAAAAMELVHSFSLIHDDIQDGSTERHHQASIWKLWGEAQAINVGDAVYTLAHLTLLRLIEKGIALEKLVRLLRILDEACLKLCEGQYLDITYENRIDVVVEDYLNMVTKKTAALVAASTCMGALLGMETVDEDILNNFYLSGIELGLVYQICDDILGIWGTEGKTGKPIGDDLIKKKKTLPIIYGLLRSGGNDKERLLEIYCEPIIEGPAISKIKGILDKIDARGYCQTLAEKHYQQALKYIKEKDPYSELEEIADFFIRRDY